ncbi:MAG: hypothetical protein CFK52_12850 [Chloracidobacterium sp. CP2_5A]|nr:MAG: hypothetical protein CFK52_12850 [Chloracidobacterium sp. CP2_5A]
MSFSPLELNVDEELRELAAFSGWGADRGLLAGERRIFSGFIKRNRLARHRLQRPCWIGG